MTQRQLILVNNSNEAGNLVIFQQSGAFPRQSATELAWFSKYAYPGTAVSFQWDPGDFDFVWSGAGQIENGVVFEAAQVLPANLTTSNKVILSYDPVNHVFFFHNQCQGDIVGTFTIQQDSSLPVNAATVGIGVAGKASIAMTAQPNINLMIDSNASYWVTFGAIAQGAFFDIKSALPPVQVDFPPNVNSMTVTLNADKTFTMKPNIMMFT